MGSAWSAAGAARVLPATRIFRSRLQMGTLSKAVGAYGGYLCASAPVIDLIRNRARTLIYSTGLPPACVAASIAALDLIEREPGLRRAAGAEGQGFHAAAPACPRRKARSCR